MKRRLGPIKKKKDFVTDTPGNSEMTRKFFKGQPRKYLSRHIFLLYAVCCTIHETALCNFMQNAVEYLFPCLLVQLSTFRRFLLSARGTYVSKLFKRSQVDEPFPPLFPIGWNIRQLI